MKSDFPEQVWCRITKGISAELFIGVCYRTPNDSIYQFDINESLSYMISEIAGKNFMLMGDFNYSNIDWHQHTCQGSENTPGSIFLVS